MVVPSSILSWKVFPTVNDNNNYFILRAIRVSVDSVSRDDMDAPIVEYILNFKHCMGFEGFWIYSLPCFRCGHFIHKLTLKRSVRVRYYGNLQNRVFVFLYTSTYSSTGSS